MTARRLALTQLPDWPRFLSLNQAAAYVGVSPAVFLAEVRQKVWPGPRRRGAKAAQATWDKAMLDAAADRQAGIGSSSAPVPEEDPKVLEESRNRILAKVEKLRAKTGIKKAS
jgi:hypothetical protein